MDFLEALRQRAIETSKTQGFFDYSPTGGIKATIEALKEMMVAKPIRGNLVQEDEGPGCEWTTFVDERDDEYVIGLGHIGTDGEEVVVMVFRDDKGRKV